MTFKKLNIIFWSLLTILSTSCIKEPVNDQEDLVNSFDRAKMLENTCENYILPAYEAYNESIDILDQELQNFQSGPSLQSFQNLKSTYYNCLIAWQSISFLNFGPAESIVLIDQSNIFPVDTSLILSNISSGNYDLALSSNFTGKGWQAIDFLLHQDPDETISFNKFSNSSPSLQYCQDVINDLKFNANYVLSSWQSYANEFKENSASNASGSAVSEMLNASISYYEMYLRKGKIGIPIGIFNGFTQQPMPNHTEGYYGLSDLIYADKAILYYQRFLNGESLDGNVDGLGLLDYANYVEATVDGKELSTVINQQFEKIHLANDLCIGSWSNFVQSNPPTSNEIYLEYQKLIPLLKVDLTSALGVIIVYQDNDGD